MSFLVFAIGLWPIIEHLFFSFRPLSLSLPREATPSEDDIEWDSLRVLSMEGGSGQTQ